MIKSQEDASLIISSMRLIWLMLSELNVIRLQRMPFGSSTAPLVDALALGTGLQHLHRCQRARILAVDAFTSIAVVTSGGCLDCHSCGTEGCHHHCHSSLDGGARRTRTHQRVRRCLRSKSLA